MNARAFPVSENEDERLRLLASLEVVGTAPEAEYDRFAKLATDLFDAPMAMINLVDADRVWAKARVGMDVDQIRRRDAFCCHTVVQEKVLVIPDTTADDRSADNPFVLGPPHVRFYAGAPLMAKPGHAVGTICVLDVKPRPPLTGQEQALLADLAALVTDRLNKRRLLHSVRHANSRFHKIAETSPDAVVCIDGGGNIMLWNSAAAPMFGYDKGEAIGQDVRRLVVPRERLRITRWLTDLKRRPERAANGKFEIEGLRADGVRFPTEVSYSSWHENENLVICGIIRDMSAWRESEAKLHVLATHDPLTHLPNRAAFMDHLSAAIRSAKVGKGGRRGCALLLVDLDRFKEVNDAFGHVVGDAFLKRVAERLRSFASDTVYVSRLSGDEFTIVLDNVAMTEDAAALAEEIRRALHQPLRARGQPVEVSASIGIATYPTHGRSAGELLANADLALYRAKARGGRHSQIYVSSLRDSTTSRGQIEQDICRAHREGQFSLFFQPQVRIHDGLPVGAEALLRWRHPVHGMLPPTRFLSVLETAPVVAQVGEWIIDEAIAAAAAWQREAGQPLCVSVNLFSPQLSGETLVETVMGLSRGTRFPRTVWSLKSPKMSHCSPNPAAGHALACPDRGRRRHCL